MGTGDVTETTWGQKQNPREHVGMGEISITVQTPMLQIPLKKNSEIWI